jgi:predicted RNA-binding Zn-ribbon protein involved in translation (DUF1610 family)
MGYGYDDYDERVMWLEMTCYECDEEAEVECDAYINYEITAEWKCPNCGNVQNYSRDYDGSALNGSDEYEPDRYMD